MLIGFNEPDRESDPYCTARVLVQFVGCGWAQFKFKVFFFFTRFKSRKQTEGSVLVEGNS